MKLLIDNALSPVIATELSAAGFDAVHVRELGIQHASDGIIFDRADADDRVVISTDTDFGTRLALRKVRQPSVVLWRRSEPRRPGPQARMLADVLRSAASDLDDGAVVVIQASRVRVRAACPSVVKASDDCVPRPPPSERIGNSVRAKFLRTPRITRARMPSNQVGVREPPEPAP